MQRYTYPTLDSTNNEARRLIDAWQHHPAAGVSQAEPFAVVADTQTAGRGTQGRTWISPPGAGLYLSVVHPVGGKVSNLPMTTHYTMAAGVACVEALQTLYGVTVGIKPVNALIHNGCKLGGILTEGIIQENRLQCVITGIGINLLEADRPIREHTPTSLEKIAGHADFPTDPLIENICDRLNHWYALLSDRMDGSLPPALDAAYQHYTVLYPPRFTR